LTLSFILLLVSFAVVALAALACNWIVYTMIRRVNRTKGAGSRLRFFGSSWRSVAGEYRQLYPASKLGSVLAVAICIACVSVLTTLYLLFWSVPRTLPVR
jgi:hypothetical protein